jgi:hypothetical protein
MSGWALKSMKVCKISVAFSGKAIPEEHVEGVAELTLIELVAPHSSRQKCEGFSAVLQFQRPINSLWLVQLL